MIQTKLFSDPYLAKFFLDTLAKSFFRRLIQIFAEIVVELGCKQSLLSIKHFASAARFTVRVSLIMLLCITNFEKITPHLRFHYEDLQLAVLSLSTSMRATRIDFSAPHFRDSKLYDLRYYNLLA